MHDNYEVCTSLVRTMLSDLVTSPVWFTCKVAALVIEMQEAKRRQLASIDASRTSSVGLGYAGMKITTWVCNGALVE